MLFLEKVRIVYGGGDVVLKCRCCYGSIFLIEVSEDFKDVAPAFHQKDTFYYKCYKAISNPDAYGVLIEFTVQEKQELKNIVQNMENLYKIGGTQCLKKYIEDINKYKTI